MPIGGYKFTAVILGCAVNYAAYFAEIYRSGIESIPRGQYEAAQLLGYDKRQTFMKIILPQMVKNVLPAVTNEVITLVKDTSLVYSVSYIELFATARQIAAAETTVLPLSRGGRVLLRVQLPGGLDHGTVREEAELLPLGGNRNEIIGDEPYTEII